MHLFTPPPINGARTLRDRTVRRSETDRRPHDCIALRTSERPLFGGLPFWAPPLAGQCSGVHFRFLYTHTLLAGRLNERSNTYKCFFAFTFTCSLSQSEKRRPCVCACPCSPVDVPQNSDRCAFWPQLACTDSGSTLNWTVCGFDYKFEFHFASAHQLFTVLQSINRSSFCDFLFFSHFLFLLKRRAKS